MAAESVTIDTPVDDPTYPRRRGERPPRVLAKVGRQRIHFAATDGEGSRSGRRRCGGVNAM